MQRLTITIPTEDNHGRKYDWQRWQDLELDLQTTYGGFTRVQVSGQWADFDYKGGCRIYKDESVRYEILTDRPYEHLKAIAEQWGRKLGQLSVLTTCEDIQVDFIPTGLRTCGR